MQLHCCGVESYKDWNTTKYFKDQGIPESCCKEDAVCTVEDLKDLDKARDFVYDTVRALPHIIINHVTQNYVSASCLWLAKFTPCFDSKFVSILDQVFANQ